MLHGIRARSGEMLSALYTAPGDTAQIVDEQAQEDGEGGFGQPLADMGEAKAFARGYVGRFHAVSSLLREPIAGLIVREMYRYAFIRIIKETELRFKGRIIHGGLEKCKTRNTLKKFKKSIASGCHLW